MQQVPDFCGLLHPCGQPEGKVIHCILATTTTTSTTSPTTTTATITRPSTITPTTTTATAPSTMTHQLMFLAITIMPSTCAVLHQSFTLIATLDYAVCAIHFCHYSALLTHSRVVVFSFSRLLIAALDIFFWILPVVGDETTIVLLPQNIRDHKSW